MVSRTPEEEELKKKRSALATLEAELGQRELDFTTLQVELRGFEARYLRIVGARYAELDEVEAQIAEALACLNRNNHTAQVQAAQARTQAQESVQATGDAQDPGQRHKFEPSDRLKKL